jgi:hypothetical protein
MHWRTGALAHLQRLLEVMRHGAIPVVLADRSVGECAPPASPTHS